MMRHQGIGKVSRQGCRQGRRGGRNGHSMFTPQRRKGKIGTGFGILELIFHATVRSVRKSHGNAIFGLLMNMMQTVVLVGAFYLMFDVLGMRSNSVRGDFLLYIMSGIFMFMTHTKAIGAVAGAEGPTSAMMKHAPMTTAVTIGSAALGVLYIQTLSLVLVLFIYHVAFTPISIDQPIAAYSMLVLSWFTGAAFGTVLLAAKPWAPNAVGVIQQLYSRANMLASGKMFLANTLSYKMLKLFDWNPLFHTIDQARGFTFLNYNPHYSNWHYAFYVGLVALMIGLMGEFYTRQYASVSWGARR
jgi:ABC-type polysaccharide/polyol phosphate export permease